MNLKQISFKIISMVMVFAMMFSISATTISAISWEHADHTHENGKDKIYYVSLGDSMTNGYGLPGYDGNTGAEDYGNLSYANQFAEWLGAEHAQLAMSAMRAEDLHWLLEVDYNDEKVINVIETLESNSGYYKNNIAEFDALWYSVFTNGDYWTWKELLHDYRFEVAAYCIEGHDNGEAFDTDDCDYTDVKALQIVAEYCQNSVKNADVISLGMGNGNFGVFMFGRIMEAIGFDGTPDEALIYNVENAIRELSPEMQAKVLELKAELYTAVEDYLGTSIEGNATLNALANTAVYTGLSYVLNYAGSIEAMLKLNPDAEIILVALMNTFGSNEEVEGVSLGQLLEAVFTPLNVYIAALPTYMQAANNGVYADATFYYAEAANVECIVDVYADELENEKSVVRARFVESIVGECDCTTGCFDVTCPTYKPGMVWELLIPMIGDLVPGATLMRPDLQSLVYYNKFTTADKVGYLANGMTNQIISCELYFAFEDAIVAASKGAPVTIESVLGLGAGISFDNVMANFGANAGANAAKYVADVLAILAAAKNLDVPTMEYLYNNNVDGIKDVVNNLCSVLAIRGTLATALQSDSAVAGLLGLFARCVIGNGIGSHPSVEGHNALAEAVINSYKNGYTAQEETIANIIYYVKEYHDEAYAYAYAELAAAGYIDAAQAGVAEAIEAVEALIAELEGADVSAELAAIKENLISELKLTVVTLIKVQNILANEELDWNQYNALVEDLDDHLNNVAELSLALGVAAGNYAYEVLVETLEELEVLAEELGEKACEYISEKYNELVAAIVAGVKTYSAEAADYVYNWLYNNPAKVIAFFAEYGDDAVKFIAENAELVFSVICFVALNFGEELVDLVLDNADVILPAIARWFEIHGENTWELLTVYFNALLAYLDINIDLDLELDFSSPEGIHASFDRIFSLLGDLVDLISDGVYDFLDALNILEKIEAELAKLNAHLRGLVEDKINALREFVEAKIEALKDRINAEIAELEEALKNATEDAKAAIQAKIDALKAELEALVNAEIESLEDAVAALDLLLQKGVKSLAVFVYDAITAYVEDAMRGEFTPNEDTYYVSVNGGDAYYAELLADKLSENLDSAVKFDSTVWGDIDYGMLSRADIITIGYDENELSGFAVEQMLAYIANYVDTDIRNNTNEYINEVFTLLNAAFHEIVDGKFNVDFDFDDYKTGAYDAINGTIDELLAYELIAGKELSEMDWAKYVGAENVHYVDEARAALKAELTEAGIIETYTYTIDVVAYLYENKEALGLEALDFININFAYEVLGENAYYTVEVPVADSIVFAAESYLYGNVAFQVEYGKLIVELYEINPEATIVLLGHYNAYDFELALGDVVISLDEAYGCVAGVSSLQPFVYALLSEKVAYVDISDAETVYDSYVAEGIIDNTLLTFVMMYLADSSVTDASEAGNEYIYEQILKALTIGCEHKYDNACDETCNKCGELREVADHVYDNACDKTCNECGELREVGNHEYEGGVCIHCGHKKPTPSTELDPNCVAGIHYFDDCDDTTCYKCSYVRDYTPHTYDNCEDTDCNVCGEVRVATGHVYSNACDNSCNRCGETREAAAHVYSGCTDAICNVCGAERTASAHVVDDCTDNVCNVCGQNVGTEGHKYGDWTATGDSTKVRVCTVCSHKETKTIAAVGLSGGAIAGIVIGSVVVAGAAGFAIYWFLIQKKSFAALMEAAKKLVGNLTGSAAEAAPAAEAEAPEAAETEAPVSEEETK